MARMRSLKPEFWLDRKLARSLTRDQRMLYLGLWNQADEHARAQADPRLIQGQVFPYEDDLTPGDIDVMLKALEVAGVVQLYEVDGDPYLYLPKLGKHQRLEPTKVDSRHPSPPCATAEDQPDADPSDTDARAAQTDPSAAQTDPGGARTKHVAGSREHEAGTRGADESAPRRAGDDDGFAEFWQAYPRREARRRAEQAWRSALKRADSATILAGLARFRWPDDPKFVPLPASWLNADRWADQPPLAAVGAGGRQNPTWEL